MDIQSAHRIFIMLHGASGVVSFLAGAALIFLPQYLTNRVIFGVYSWTLVGMLIFLAGAMLVYWPEYSSIEQIIFPALLGLGLYMLYRAWSANRSLRSKQNNWKPGYIEDIGFTLISLFDGFIIIAILNAGGPGWLVAVLAVLAVLVGRWAVGLAQKRVA